MLSPLQIAQFTSDGYVRVDGAFSREVAAEARAILWRDTGCDPEDPTTWTRPVIRLGMYAQPPFLEVARSRVLDAACDQLVGAGRWLPRGALGTFPVRFPSPDHPGDTGWHVDASFVTRGHEDAGEAALSFDALATDQLFDAGEYEAMVVGPRVKADLAEMNECVDGQVVRCPAERVVDGGDRDRGVAHGRRAHAGQLLARELAQECVVHSTSDRGAVSAPGVRDEANAPTFRARERWCWRTIAS